MIAAANFSNASWMSKRFSNRIRSLPNPANHPCVLSTTQRCLPSFSLLSTPRRAIRLAIPRRLRSARQRGSRNLCPHGVSQAACVLCLAGQPPQGLIPVTQASPVSHAPTIAQGLGKVLPWKPACSTNRMPR